MVQVRCWFTSYTLTIKQKITKKVDVVDVWFDSGNDSRLYARKQTRASLPGGFVFGRVGPASWMVSVVPARILRHTRKGALQAVLTHGFVLDEKGYKMSKSLGMLWPHKRIEKMGLMYCVCGSSILITLMIFRLGNLFFNTSKIYIVASEYLALFARSFK